MLNAFVCSCLATRAPPCGASSTCSEAGNPALAAAHADLGGASQADAPPRKSIEIRAVAFFDPPPLAC